MRRFAATMIVLLAVAGVAFADSTPATTITFTSLASTFDAWADNPVPQGYGALATLGVSYSNACYWNGPMAYATPGDLTDSIYACDNSTMSVTFTPLQGTAWTLNSFDLAAAWSGLPFRVDINGSDGVLLWSTGDISVTGVGHDTFNPNVTFTSPVTLTGGVGWNVNLSNLDLVDPPAEVPEPTSLTLIGLGALALFRRRR